MARKNISQIDTKTGEILTGGILAYVPPKRTNGFGRGWLAMSQEAMKELAKRRKEIGGEGYAVMLAIMGDAEFNNRFKAVNQAQIADDLGMQRSHVSRAVKKLVTLGIISEGPREGLNRTYRVTPFISWKGDSKAHVYALAEERRKREDAKQ